MNVVELDLVRDQLICDYFDKGTDLCTSYEIRCLILDGRRCHFNQPRQVSELNEWMNSQCLECTERSCLGCPIYQEFFPE